MLDGPCIFIPFIISLCWPQNSFQFGSVLSYVGSLSAHLALKLHVI
jgi:hypothetical protein